METSSLHNWMPNLFIGAGVLEGLSHVTVVQEYRCNRCGETISLPLCNKLTCQIFMSLGCAGKIARIPWKAPIKSRSIEDSDINKKDYPAKKRKPK